LTVGENLCERLTGRVDVTIQDQLFGLIDDPNTAPVETNVDGAIVHGWLLQ
jgi:hypothetical protein